MLAAVLVLTVIPPTVLVGRAVIEHACFLITQKLLEGDEVCSFGSPVFKMLMITDLPIGRPMRQNTCHCFVSWEYHAPRMREALDARPCRIHSQSCTPGTRQQHHRASGPRYFRSLESFLRVFLLNT